MREKKIEKNQQHCFVNEEDGKEVAQRKFQQLTNINPNLVKLIQTNVIKDKKKEKKKTIINYSLWRTASKECVQQ